VVRALLVPALVSLFGRWNWWLPPWAARLMRVAPAMAHAEQASQATSPIGREVAQPSENRGTSTG
jgi:RND superfamily putative drug exporter